MVCPTFAWEVGSEAYNFKKTKRHAVDIYVPPPGAHLLYLSIVCSPPSLLVETERFSLHLLPNYDKAARLPRNISLPDQNFQ